MHEAWERARARYQAAALPEELAFAVAGAVRRGERQRKGRRALRRAAATALAGCACFALLLNVSPTFAQAVEAVPVLGALARVVTVREYRIEDKEHLIDVRLPALKNTGNTDLEQRVNTEISTRIQQVLDEAEARARADKEAFVATGGQAEDFIPIIIDVDYEIKCQNGHYLSFVLTKTETLASAYTEYYAYNIDLETGRELTLWDLLGPDWKRIANEAVRAGIDERSQDPANVYFDGSDGIEGFQSIRDDQPFYLTDTQLVVLCKAGEQESMQRQEHEVNIPLERLQGLLKEEYR